MRRKLRKCKNGHPLFKYRELLLTNAVVVCDNCGYKHMYSNIPGVYVGDEKNHLKSLIPYKALQHIFLI